VNRDALDGGRTGAGDDIRHVGLHLCRDGEATDYRCEQAGQDDHAAFQHCHVLRLNDPWVRLKGIRKGNKAEAAEAARGSEACDTDRRPR